MEIDVQKTRQYYQFLKKEDFCSCDYCMNFYQKAKSAFPETAKWLDSHGIDIEKPFETLPIEVDRNHVEYISAQYIAFGACEESFQLDFGESRISFAHSHPDTRIEEQHFVLEFFPQGIQGSLTFMEDKDDEVFIRHLYNQMKSNSKLGESFETVGSCSIIWKLSEQYQVTIEREYLGVDRITGKFPPKNLIHWHPQDEEMYQEICNLGTKGNVTVIYKPFDLSLILYSGPRDQCKYRRKWLCGKYYYLYAEEG